jgi:hypothetical protein
MGGSSLMTDIDDLHAETVARLIDMADMAPRQGEYHLNAFLFQLPDYQFASSHLAHP